MIEKAQQEGRAYRNYDENQSFSDHENLPDDDTEAAHIPRRARTFGTGLSTYHHGDHYQVQDVRPSLDAVDVAKSYMLTPTADPFVPENVDGHVAVNWGNFVCRVVTTKLSQIYL